MFEVLNFHKGGANMRNIDVINLRSEYKSHS